MDAIRVAVGICLIGIAIGSDAKAKDERSHSEPVEWGYGAENGPRIWGRLGPQYGLCTAGERQSPINLVDAKPAPLPALVFRYRSNVPRILNNGHTVEVLPTEKNWIEFEDAPYELLQFHFHTPSEHMAAGQSFDMEIHLVHRDEKGSLAVVGVLVRRGLAHRFFDVLVDHLPATGEPVPMHRALDASELLPSVRQAFHYEGSLTTPPCSEGVKWFLLATPIEASDAQLAAFEAVLQGNSRPVQRLNGRDLFLDAGR